MLAYNEVIPSWYYFDIRVCKHMMNYYQFCITNSSLGIPLYNNSLAYNEILPIWYYFYIAVFWHILK